MRSLLCTSQHSSPFIRGLCRWAAQLRLAGESRCVICCLNRHFVKSNFVFSSAYDIFRMYVTFYCICLRSTTWGFDTHIMKRSQSSWEAWPSPPSLPGWACGENTYICSLSIFREHGSVVQTVVAMLCSHPQNPFVLWLEVCPLWTAPSAPSTRAPSSLYSTLRFCEVDFLEIPYVSQIMQYLSFCVGLISLSIMSSRPIQKW